MSSTNLPESKLLLEVARAAWEGNLFEKQGDLCQLAIEEFQTLEKREEAIQSVRKAMGLPTGTSTVLLTAEDKDALLGLENTYLAMAGVQSELACSLDALGSKATMVPLIEMLKNRTTPVYATVAPAFTGQFGPEVTAGKLRSALLKVGFADMAETALGADLVAMKEALEFCAHVHKPGDILITSCCCPVWVQLITARFPQLRPMISPSVSPMVASGRVIKDLYPESKVVFIGPCMAKKAEATMPDVAGTIDFVLTFQELKNLFEAAGVDPAQEPDNESAQASWAGRVFARTGGVSDAVQRTLEKLVPERAGEFNPTKVDGVPDCLKVLQDIADGTCSYNFVEGMGCKGGCVGGPGKLVDAAITGPEVDIYGDKSIAKTPVDNPAIYALLARLGGAKNMQELRSGSPIADLLNRNFVVEEKK